MKKLLALITILAFTTAGCASVKPGQLVLFPKPYEKVEVPEVAPIPDDAPLPVELDHGEPLPGGVPFDGVLLCEPELAQLVASADQLSLVKEGLDLCYQGRDNDRTHATTVLDARDVQLIEAREAQGRWFVAGLGAGAVVVSALFGGIFAAVAAGK